MIANFKINASNNTIVNIYVVVKFEIMQLLKSNVTNLLKLVQLVV